MLSALKSLFRNASSDSSAIHYLHIGKTAGNQIKAVCEQMTGQDPSLKFALHGHGMRLYRLPPDVRYFFSVRHPVSRFQSAFYERKRQGRGGKNTWSEHERHSFTTFPHAVNLAEILFDDSVEGRKARASMHSIQHVRTFHFSWFHPHGHFLEVRPPIWILRQEHFDDDLDVFAKKLGLDHAPLERADSYRAKISSYEDVPPLSKKAIANLERWYAADIMFYDDCTRWLDGQSGQLADKV